MQKSDLIQTCAHLFNVSPLKETLKEIFNSKQDHKRIAESGIDELMHFINEKMTAEEIIKLIFGNFLFYTQEIHVFHVTNMGKKAFNKDSINSLLSNAKVLNQFSEMDNVKIVHIHSEVGRINMMYEVAFEGYLLDPGTTAPTGSRKPFSYFLPIMVEFLAPCFIKIRVNKYAIRTGNRTHFNGNIQLLLDTNFSISEIVDEVTAVLNSSPIKMSLDPTNLLKSVIKTADKKEISATVIKWDEKDGVHFTHRGRNNRTLHPYTYIQKVLQQEALGVGDGTWYFTDPKKSAGSQPLKDLSGIRVFPAQGFISYDSYRREEIEDKVNEFIKLAQ